MLRISKLADYATILMTVFGQHEAASFSAVQLAELTGISLPTVRKILTLLLQAELLTSTQGASGGYGLTRAIQQINLADIVEAIDGPLALTECNDPNRQCDKHEFCGTKQHWEVINQVVKQALQSVNLQQMQQSTCIKSVIPLVVSQ